MWQHMEVTRAFKASITISRVGFLFCAQMSAKVTWFARLYSTLCHSSVIGGHVCV